MNPDWKDITAEDEYTLLFELGDGAQVEVAVRRDDGKWVEGRVIQGEAPYGWGGKTYQRYLTPYEIQRWLESDYDYAELIDVY